MKEEQAIAQTILEQLQTLGRIKVMSWGANSWQFGKDEKHNAFLQFKVNGFKFKGRVRITYMAGWDVYQITFRKTRSDEIVKTVEDVYFDEMVDIIDRYVETENDKSADYQKKANNFLNKTIFS